MPDPTRWPGRKIEPAPTRQPVGSGRVRVGSGRAYVKCRVPSGFSGFGSKFLAHARPVSHTGSKILTRARPSNSSGRVGSGYFRAGWVGSVGSGSPCPGLALSSSPKYSHRGRLGGVWRSGAQLWPTWAQWSPQPSKENAQYSPVEFQPIMGRINFCNPAHFGFLDGFYFEIWPTLCRVHRLSCNGVSCFASWEK